MGRSNLTSPPHEWRGQSHIASLLAGEIGRSSPDQPLRRRPIPAASGGTSPLRGEEPPPHEWGGAISLHLPRNGEDNLTSPPCSPGRSADRVRISPSGAAPSPPQAAVLPHFVGKSHLPMNGEDQSVPPRA